MIQTNVRISNKLGLHARASAKLTKLGVMMLAAGMGTEVHIEVEGEDEQAAMEALRTLIYGKFGESE